VHAQIGRQVTMWYVGIVWFLVVNFWVNCCCWLHGGGVLGITVPAAFQSNSRLVNTFTAPPSAPASSVGRSSSIKDSPSIQDVIKLLSTFEIDTHFEIVLIGKSIQPQFVNELSSALDVLSAISAGSSPTEFVHEKVIYHVSLGSTIVDDVLKVIQDGPDGVINPQDISKLLQDYHFKASTLSTLFILYFPLKDTNFVEGYTYSSPLTECRSCAYIASEGFAWLDLTADAYSILPMGPTTAPILPALEYSGDDVLLEAHQLAADVHRSVEALSPFPVSVFSTAINNSSSTNTRSSVYDNLELLTNTRQVFAIVVAAICADFSMDVDNTVGAEGPPTLACKADPDTLSIVRQLVDIYSTQFLQIRIVEMGFDISTPSIAHAIHASTHFNPTASSTSTSGSSMEVLDTQELLYWLSASVDIRDGLAEILESIHDTTAGGFNNKVDTEDVHLMPVFVLRFPENINVVFDNEHQRLVKKPFPLPPGGWFVPVVAEENFETMTEGLQTDTVTLSRADSNWPRHAILSLSSVAVEGVQVNVPPDTRTSASKSLSVLTANVLGCFRVQPFGFGDISVLPATASSDKKTNSFNHDDLFHAMRQLLWGIAPPYYYYSSITQSFVYDYLWYTPSVLGDDSLDSSKQSINDRIFLNSNRLSFRDRRSLARLTTFAKSESVLHAFAQALSEAYSLVPPVNIPELLELTATSSSSQTATKSKQQQKLPQTKTKQAPGKQPLMNGGILESFLGYMDLVSSNIAHHQFETANTNLANADQLVYMLERKIKRIIMLRMGTVTCSSAVAVDGANSDNASKDGLIRQMLTFFWGSKSPLSAGGGTISSSRNSNTVQLWRVFVVLCGFLGVGLGVFVSLK
jgi:hypothetical protein